MGTQNKDFEGFKFCNFSSQEILLHAFQFFIVTFLFKRGSADHLLYSSYLIFSLLIFIYSGIIYLLIIALCYFLKYNFKKL